MREPKFQLYAIAEPTDPVAWERLWTSSDLATWFVEADAKFTQSGEAWWKVTGLDRWEPILELLESAVGSKNDWNAFIHTRCSVALQVIDVLTQLEGEVGNGGLSQWIGNRPQRALSVVQSLRMIGLEAWADDLHKFSSAIAMLGIAELFDPNDFVAFSSSYPIQRIRFGRYRFSDLERFSKKFDFRLHGAGRKIWAEKLRSFAQANAGQLPRGPATN
jgi:hypothetical protein